MCGICGAVWTDAIGALAAESLMAMMDRLVHRGPDERVTSEISMLLWDFDGWRSSTWPAVISRFRTRMARSGRYSTVRFITTRHSDTG